jgi:DegV family protein with EDD domain
VPVLLIPGGWTFLDGVDITSTEVYRRLRAGEAAFSSVAPSVPEFLRVYEAATQGASGVLSLHMSPELSSTYGVALAASKQVEGVPTVVFNSNSAVIGQGFVVVEAVRAAAPGATLEQVVRRAEEISAKIHFLFTLDTFEYLRESGRMGRATALLGNMLQVRVSTPVICSVSMLLSPLEKDQDRRVADICRCVPQLTVDLSEPSARSRTRPPHNPKQIWLRKRGKIAERRRAVPDQERQYR